MRRARRHSAWLLTAAVLAACSTVRLFGPAPSLPPPSPAKPLVVMVCGWGESPGHSRLTPLAERLAGLGFEVRVYAWDTRDLAWESDRPVVGIGFSYGGHTLARASLTKRVDRLILVNGVRQGNVFEQGQPLEVGRGVKLIDIYAGTDAFPKASTAVFRSGENGFAEAHTEILTGVGHTGIIGKVEQKIIITLTE